MGWMVANQCENPFYEHFDRLLEICREYDITLSLGDGLRPGSLKVCTMCGDMRAVKRSRRVADLLNIFLLKKSPNRWRVPEAHHSACCINDGQALNTVQVNRHCKRF